MAVLWVIFYPKYFMSVTVKRISKIVDEGKNEDMLGQHSLRINEETWLSNTYSNSDVRGKQSKRRCGNICII